LKNITPYLILFTLIISSCSQESNSFVSKSYHNVTARYNAYFLAQERMKEIENKIQAQQKYDFNDIIRYHPVYDSNFTKGLDADFEYIGEKAKLPIAKHKNSNWLDDSYIIIADARFYREKIDSAILIYKYTNTTGSDDNDRHKALIRLMRVYMSIHDYNKSNETYSYLLKQELDKDNQRDLHLAAFEKFRIERNTDSMLAHIESATPFIKKKDDKSRAMFIAGQLHQTLNEDKKAFKLYKKTIKKRPPYEMEFNSRVNLAQVSDISDKKTITSTYKYFYKLLADEKNKEFQDRIYYELGRFELKQGHTKKGIDFLYQSLHCEGQTENQDIYTHLLLGKTYYYDMAGKMNDVKRFTNSKLHYDSATVSIPPSFKDYDKIIERKDVLTDFVEQFTTIATNDSLIWLASLSKTDLDKIIKDRKAYDEKILRQEKEKTLQQAKEAQAVGTQEGSIQITKGRQLIFYKPGAVLQGRFIFQEKWGDIKLEDNWRRSEKDFEFNDDDDSTQTNITNDSTQVNQDSLSTQIDNIFVDIQQYYDAIPVSATDKSKLEQETKVAIYKLGKIYKLRLIEEENALNTFNRHLGLFRKSQYTPEILYIMYFSCQSNDTCDAQQYAVRAHKDYPNDIFTKLIDNPNYFKDNEGENKKAHDMYERAFLFFKKGAIFESRRIIKQTITQYPENDIADHLDLILAMTYAKTDQMAEYFNKITLFIENYPTSDLVPFAKNLIEEAKQNGITKSSFITAKDSIYQVSQDSTRSFILMLNKHEISYQKGLNVLFEFNNTYYDSLNFEVRKVSLNDSSYIVVVKTLNKLSFAHKYVTKFKHFLAFRELLKGKEYEYYLIDNRNYQILLNTKKTKKYREFYTSQN